MQALDLCAEFDIKIIPTNESRVGRKTHAGRVIERMIEDYGVAHTRLVLMTIVETRANENELRRVAAMGADLVNLRKTFAPKEPDRADLYGELQRWQLRNKIEAMPPEKRLRAVMDNPRLTEAVLLATDPILSGLSTVSEDGAPSQYDIVREHYLEKTFGEQLKGVEARERVVETVDAALKVATIQFRNESGLSEAEITAALR